MSANKILIVDDAPDIREVIDVLLRREGYSVVQAENGLQAYELVRSRDDFVLVIMDIMMPEMSGIDACVKIREISTVPILFLTAKAREVDKVNAYYKGGDDYIVKPFSKNELIAKVKAMIRRYTRYVTKESQEKLVILGDEIAVNIEKRTVAVGDKKIKITDKEFEILKYLIEHRGETVRNHELYESIWGEKYMQASGNTIMVHVLNLRKKLETDANSPKIIKTVWGRGYTID